MIKREEKAEKATSHMLIYAEVFEIALHHTALNCSVLHYTVGHFADIQCNTYSTVQYSAVWNKSV